MALKNFSNFIYFSRNTMGNSGKPVYIDPNLIVDFVTYVNPNDQKNGGQSLVIEISNTLISISAGGADGSSIQKSNKFYKDIKVPNLPGVRLYYQTFQDKVEGVSRGPGIYIYDLKPLKNNEIETEGLYKVYHSNDKWIYDKKNNNLLDEKLFFISAIKDTDNRFSAQTTAGSIVSHRHQKSDKSSSNLYYCPSYLTDNGEAWAPNDRLSKTASADELAQILIDSENKWIAGHNFDYETIVEQDGVKVLIKALEKVKLANIKLTSHKFSLNAPYAEIHKLEKLIDECGGLKSKSENSTKNNKISALHQAMTQKLLSEQKVLSSENNTHESNITFADLVKRKGFDHEAS